MLAHLEKQLEGCVEDGVCGHALGIYAVLLTGLIGAAEKCSTISKSGGPSLKKQYVDEFDWTHLKCPVAEAIKRCLALELPRVLPALASREAIVSHLVKSTHSLLENPAGLKTSGLKRAVQEGWVLAVGRHGYGTGMKALVMQDLQYFEPLMEPLAEFLALLQEREAGASSGSSTLLVDLLEAIGRHAYSVSESGAVRNATTILTSLARSVPRDVLRALPHLVGQLDSESYVLRCGMVEVLGLLLGHLASPAASSDGAEEQGKTQARSLLTVLQERLLDVNAFVRARVIQVFAEGLRSGWLPVTQRARLLAALLPRIRDKSSNVRRKAIQILGDFLRTHPFCVEGGELSLAYFAQRLAEIDRLLARVSIDDGKDDDDSNGVDDEMDVDQPGTDVPNTDLPMSSPSANKKDEVSIDAPLSDPAQISTLLLQKRYYTDALQFVRQLEAILPTLCQLLGSRVKAEVGDVIDWFVEAHAYRLDGAAVGLRRMMHLVWGDEQQHSTLDQQAGEDGPKHSVREHLFQAYKRVYLETDPGMTGKERCEGIAQNLLGMVRGATLAELASLEPILAAMLVRRWIPDGVVPALLAMLAGPAGEQRRATLVLLAFMAGPKRAIIAPRMDVLLRSGFAPDTDPVSAQYTLRALRSLASEGSRLPVESPVFVKILDFIRLAPCIGSGAAWLEPITEAIKTVYALADTPGRLAEPLIQELHADIFCGMEDVIDAGRLTRLLHCVGAIAAAESGHLDSIERHWKRSKSSTSTRSSELTELEMISGMGAPEDDFAEAVGQVRDRELLHSPDALLAPYGPLVACIARTRPATR